MGQPHAERIGLDFGTTNSAFCYYDPVRRAFRFLQFNGQTLEFFPTMIAYRKSDGARYIGEAAKRYRFSSSFDFYEHFKLYLGRNAEETSGRERSPLQVTQDFLEEVLKKFNEQTGIVPESLVMTVPDIWKNEEQNRCAVDNLTHLYAALGYEEEQAAFESEPVSAAVYYCMEICGGEYRGELAVVDYGGGTLDLTLCRVDEEDGRVRITVLARCGVGGEGGCAGAAFDQALTERLVKKYGLDPTQYAPDAPLFVALRDSLEAAKIASTTATRTALYNYYLSYDPLTGDLYGDDPQAFLTPGILPGEDYEVNASDIAETFERVNAPALNEALARLLEQCREQGVNTQSQERFRVLMVGGFSNLYCVESKVRDAFASADGIQDLRFDNGMRLEDRSTAIAHGAAIAASEMVGLVYLCENDVGFYYYDPCTESEEAPVLIERGKPVLEFREPRYFDYLLEVNPQGRTCAIRLFFDDGRGKVPVRMDETLLELCPNLDVPENTYQIGLSMGKHRIPMIHIRDRSGAERRESLNKLVERISLRRSMK